MKFFFNLILSLLTIAAFAQTPPTIKHIFYDLPLDKSRADIKKAIISDTRFTSKEKSTDPSIFNMSTYLGFSSDQGMVQSKADFVEMELTFGFCAEPTRRVGKLKYRNITLFKTRYFFSSRESAEKEYQHMLNLLRPILKDTSCTFVGNGYADSIPTDESNATGMYFHNKKPYFKILVLKADITKNYFGLFIEYEAEEIKER